MVAHTMCAATLLPVKGYLSPLLQKSEGSKFMRMWGYPHRITTAIQIKEMAVPTNKFISVRPIQAKWM